ncbi:MAG: hypothetical protein ACTHNE_15015 [Dyella sp.]|uniref:hypothetical protein n=1 Tax=Dyella sp. TaxID=1869338 RepID=UPI003F8239A1
MQTIAQAQVGDLIYIPGQVTMLLGREHGQPYVILDVGGLVFRADSGEMRRPKTSEVSGTPLLSLWVSERLLCGCNDEYCWREAVRREREATHALDEHRPLSLPCFAVAEVDRA